LLCQQTHQPSLNAPTSSSTPNNNRTATTRTPLKKVSQSSANLKKILKLKINQPILLLLWCQDGRNLLLPSSHKMTNKTHLLKPTPDLIQMKWSSQSLNTLNNVISEWEPPRKLTPLVTTSKVSNRTKRKATEQSSQRIDHMPWSLCFNYTKPETTHLRPCSQVPASSTDMSLSLDLRISQSMTLPSLQSRASSSEPSSNNQITPTSTTWFMPSMMSMVTQSREKTLLISNKRSCASLASTSTLLDLNSSLIVIWEFLSLITNQKCTKWHFRSSHSQ